MAVKTYVVREGFSYRVLDEKNNLKVYSEGDTIDLETDVGDNTHQLERAAKTAAAAG